MTYTYCEQKGSDKMICSVKTKILFALLVTSIILSVCVSAFAANTVNITSAHTGGGITLSDTAENAPKIEAEDKITVNLSAQAGTNITILVLDASKNVEIDEIKPTDIIYANQQKLGPTTSSYSFTFSLPENIAFGTYAVYIGSDGVDVPAAKYFKIPPKTVSYTYLSGDFDKNGKADLVDAIYILRYTSATPSTAWDVIAGDVNSDGSITSDDAKYIMHYVLGITLPEGVSVGVQLSVDIPADN